MNGVVPDESGAEKRHEAENHRCRIKPGIRDEPRGPHPLAGEFGKSVDGLLDEIGRFVRFAVHRSYDSAVRIR